MDKVPLSPCSQVSPKKTKCYGPAYFNSASIASKNKGAISGVGVFTAHFTPELPTLHVNSTKKGILGGTLPEK